MEEMRTKCFSRRLMSGVGNFSYTVFFSAIIISLVGMRECGREQRRERGGGREGRRKEEGTKEGREGGSQINGEDDNNMLS